MWHVSSSAIADDLSFTGNPTSHRACTSGTPGLRQVLPRQCLRLVDSPLRLPGAAAMLRAFTRGTYSSSTGRAPQICHSSHAGSVRSVFSYAVAALKSMKLMPFSVTELRYSIRSRAWSTARSSPDYIETTRTDV